MCLHCLTIMAVVSVPFLPIAIKEWDSIQRWGRHAYTWATTTDDDGVLLSDWELVATAVLVPVLFGAAIVFGMT